MKELFSLFGWMPGPLKALCVGGLAIFVLIGVYRIIRSIIEFILDLIPGW